MSELTTDKNDPELHEVGENGQNKKYLVLTDRDKKMGYVRPYRDTYSHVGIRPEFPLRELTKEEHERYDKFSYTAFEQYPNDYPCLGRFWTAKQLNSGCGCDTTMNSGLAATYAMQPDFYGSTFCCNCGAHFPVAEFVWTDDKTVVGS